MTTNKEITTEKTKDAAPGIFPRSLGAFEEFDDFFEDFLSRRWFQQFDRNFPFFQDSDIPKIDIIDQDDQIELKAALPGVEKDDLEVSITNQLVTIRTFTKKEEKKEGKYFRREIHQGEFQRTLSLPDNIDSDKAKASFNNGLLTLTIPKTEKSKRKRIEIS